MKGTLGFRLRTRTCISCGTVYTKHMSPSKPHNYCSLKCYRKSKRPNRKTGGTVICSFCGESCYKPKGQLHQHARHFCSLEHANLWQTQQKAEGVCKSCKRSFQFSPSANRIYCSQSCRDVDPDKKKQLVAMNERQQKQGGSKLEKDGYVWLDSVVGIEQYKKQHLVSGKFTVDALIEPLGVVIQFDGDYWHGNPKQFPNPDHRQKKRMNLDRSQDAYMHKCGYKVFRIWESDFRKDLEAVTAALQLLLTAVTQTHALPESNPREIA